MKYRNLTICIILGLLMCHSCKKDTDPTISSFKIVKETEKIVVGTTEATISGTYDFPGKINSIKVRISTDEQLFGSDIYATEVNGKAYSVHITGLHPGTIYYYRYEVDYGTKEDYLTDISDFTTQSESPIVKTLETLALDSTTFRIKCEVLSGGGQDVTERGICWNTFGDPTLDDETMQHASGGVGQYTLRIEDLALSTKYYVRAYAKNASGIGFGEVLDFETLGEAQLPEVSTVEVSGMTSTTASCMGNVASDGGLELTERGVCWSLSANPTLTGSHAAATVATLGVFEVAMTGLTPNKTYHVRAYATNAKGTAYGTDLTFTTTEGLPVVTTSGITEITATSAKGGGEVTDQGASNVTERGICWSTSHNPTMAGTHTSSGTGVGCYTVSMTNLTPNATYYVRAYAKNSAGVSYGSEVNFTTSQNISAPTVTTSQVTNITQTTATGGGNVTSDGGATVTEHGICWSTNHNPTTSGSHSNSGTGMGLFTVNMTGLTPNTTYYVRAYAINSAGTSYGSEVSCTTQQAMTYTISVSANPSNGGSVSGGGIYSYGQSCTVNATSASGFYFVNWTEGGNVVSSNSEYTFAITSNRELVANFSIIEGEWLHYDNGVYATSIGVNGNNMLFWASMFPVETISQYADTYLNKIALYENNHNTTEITVSIFCGGTTAPGTMVSTMSFNPIGGDAFHEVVLNTPVAIDGTQNLWIVFSTSSNGTYPASACADTGEANNRWVSVNGSDWADMANVAPGSGSGYGWMIRGYVSFGKGCESVIELESMKNKPQTIIK